MLEFTFNKEGILSALAKDQTVTLNEKPENWKTAGDFTVSFDNTFPTVGRPLSFVEYPDGHTSAIYDMDDMYNLALVAPIDSVYYIQPDQTVEEIYLWVKKETGWHRGTVRLKVSYEQRREVNEIAEITSSELFNKIKDKVNGRKPFDVFYYVRNGNGVKILEKAIGEYIDLVNIIFDRNIMAIKYLANDEQQPAMLTYARTPHHSWKRIINKHAQY